jgi:O-antigen/teichoic acid export membrane protein
VRLAEGRALQPLWSQSRAVSFVCGTVFSVGVCVAVPFLYGGGAHAEAVFAAVLLTMLAVPFTVDVAMLSTLSKLKGESWRFSLVVQITQPLARIGFTAAALWMGPSLWSLALASSAGIALSWVVFSVVERELRQDAPRPDKGLDREVFQVGLVLGGSVVAAGLMRTADVFILSLFVSVAAVGAYAALSFVASLVQAVASAFAFGQGPKTAAVNLDHGPEKLVDELSAVAWRAAPASLFLFGGVAVFGEHLSVVFGPGFVVDPSVAALLAGANLVGGLLSVYGYALSMTGRHREEAAVMLGGCLALVVALFLGASTFGMLGAAGAVFAVVFMVQLVRLALVENYHRVRCMSGACLPLLLAPAVWGLAQGAQVMAQQVFADGWALLLAGSTLYALLFGLGLSLALIGGHLRRKGRYRDAN